MGKGFGIEQEQGRSHQGKDIHLVYARVMNCLGSAQQKMITSKWKHDTMYEELITALRRRAVAWITEPQAEGQLLLLCCLLINAAAR